MAAVQGRHHILLLLVSPPPSRELRDESTLGRIADRDPVYSRGLLDYLHTRGDTIHLSSLPVYELHVDTKWYNIVFLIKNSPL